MSVSFNSDGNLHKTIELSIEAFRTIFGTTDSRKEKIKNALLFFEIFASCGCRVVYICGSFVSSKKDPEDIDLCFDLTGIDEQKLKSEFPQLHGLERIKSLGKIRRDLEVHIFTFDTLDTEIFEFFRKDRYGNAKGLVKIDLQNR